MELAGRTVLITGGAGFIGAHLADRLIDDGATVRIVDDLSNGDVEWVPASATLIKGDLTDAETAESAITTDLDLVFHCAADKAADRDDIEQFRLNNRLTECVIERMDAVGVDRLAFTSSSTVYGEAAMPTPEDHVLEPISVYGASKVAEESLLSVYAHSHDIQSWVFRFANIVGPRLQPGAVIVDFIEKLKDNPDSLTILGDGRQEKSYMHVTDCVEAMCHVVETADDPFNVYNLGTRTTTSVTRIADIVADTMGLSPTYEFTGGERGWVGDVPRMRLSIEKLSALGFEPSMGSEQAVRQATTELVEERT